MELLEWDLRDLILDWYRRMTALPIDPALIAALQQVNAARVSSSDDSNQGEEGEVLEVLRQASDRLAVLREPGSRPAEPFRGREYPRRLGRRIRSRKAEANGMGLGHWIPSH